MYKQPVVDLVRLTQDTCGTIEVVTVMHRVRVHGLRQLTLLYIISEQLIMSVW